jgi:hypothetical protein
MPNTPKIVTRSETTSSNTTENLNKGSKLTFAEMDSNFLELRNGSIGIVGDDSTGIDIAHGSTLKVAGTGGISTTVSGDTLTVDASSIVTTSLGDLTAVGSTLISPSNADLTLSASGTGAIVTADTVELTQNTNLTPNLVVSGYNSTFLKLGNHPDESNQGNTIYAQGSPLYLAASPASNNVISENDLSVETGNISAPNNVNMTLSVSGTGQISVDGATIGSNSIELDQLTISGNSIRTNVTNANLEFDTNGTGSIQLGDITVDAHLNNKDTFTAINIPFSSDGSTSQDVEFNMRADGAPELYFNNTGDAAGRFRVGTGSLTISAEGSNSSAGDVRIEAAGTLTLDANTINLGGDTIVVSGNRMFTDQSNEDMELLANGAGNISLLSPANMNSNKITNVTDPTANQDAATKAYVDAQVLASGDTGDLTINGSTITAPSNADLTLTVAGTGQIVVDGTLTATEVISDLTGTIEFDAKATEAITKGEAVYIAGIDGNTPTVALARANAAGTMPGFGIAADDIALNATGKITTFGSLTGLDATNFGETAITFGLGDTVYISSAEAGKLTNVAPTGESNFIQNIGKIERVTPSTNITIKVGGAGRTNATPALNEGNIFIGNSSNASSTVALSEQIKNYKAITLTGDDSTGTDVNIGETFKVAGTQNITTAVSGDTLTITGPDLSSYLTAETNDLTSAVTWANVPDANITQSSVTQHQAALSITESQISDLQSYITDANLTIVGDDSTGVTFSAKNNDDITITGTGGITSTVSGNTITIDGSGVSGGAANTGDITFVGSTMSSPSNADFTIETAGTGKIILTGLTFPDTDGTADQILGTNGSGVLSFRDPTAINIDGGTADSVYTSVPTIDGGTA